MAGHCRVELTASFEQNLDAIERRVKTADLKGVVVHFVKPSSPAAIAGLRMEDWIREIDGVEVADFASATAKLAEIEADAARAEFVVLVGRGGGFHHRGHGETLIGRSA